MARSKIWLYAAILITTTLCIYAHTARYGFIGWDDDKDVLNKPRIQQLTPASVVHLFNPFGIFRGQYYYEYFPVTDLTYMIEWHFYGKDYPQGFHLDNVLLDMINVVLIFYAVGMLLRRAGLVEQAAAPAEADSGTVQVTAFFTAMLFAVHPLMTENVAWLSGRKDLLLMMFLLLWFISFMKSSSLADAHQEKNTAGGPAPAAKGMRTEQRGLSGQHSPGNSAILWYSISFACFILAILSKFQGVIIPGVLAAYGLFINKNSWRSTLKKLLPYVVVLLVYVPYTLWYYHKGGTAFVDTKGVLWTFLFIPEALFLYARKLVLPFDLAPVYTVPSLSDTGLIAASLIFLVVLVIWIIRLFKKRDWLVLFGLSWFLANFIPVSNIIPLPTKMADRYVYEGAFGVFLIAGSWASDLYRRTAKKQAAGVLFIAIAVMLAFLSYRQSLHWAKSSALWSYTLTLQPHSPVALNNIGVYYKNHGQPKTAEQEYKLALEYDDDFVPALWNLGMMYVDSGRYEEAFPLLKRMAGIKAPEQYMACRAVGALYLKFYNAPATAKKYFELSYRLNPHQPDVKTLKMLIDTL